MKKILYILFIVFVLIGFAKSAGAVNITVPQSTAKADVLVGKANGTYGILNVGANGQCLQASSTTASGLVWASCASGSTGITTLNNQTGATQTFATSTSGGLQLNITSATDTHTFTLQPSSGFTIPTTTDVSNWNNLYNNLYTRLTVSTSSIGGTFYVSTSSPGNLTINFPANLLTTTTAASTYPSFTYASTTFLTVTTAASTYEPILTKGNLTENITGLEFDATRQVIGGAAQLSLTSGYVIPLQSTLDTYSTYSYGSSTYVSYSYASSTFPSFTYASTTFPNVTLAGQNYLSLSGQQITAAQINLTSHVTGVLPIANGGTGTSTAPSASQLLVGNGSGFDYTTLPSCSDTTNSKLLYNSTTRQFSCGTDQSGGGGSVSGGLTGLVATWASSTGLTYGTLRDNGTVSGVNATSSTVTFNVQGTAGNINPFVVASSTGTALLTVAPTGSTTIANLTTGLVRSTATGSLYNGKVTVGDMNNEDFGAFTCSGSSCNLDTTYLTGSGLNGYVPRWVSGTGLGLTVMISDGLVMGINATSSSHTFNIQGGSGVNPLNISSSTGTSLMTVTQTGNVGIGTTTPQKLLHVWGTQSLGVMRITRDTQTAILPITSYITQDVNLHTSSSTLTTYPDLTGPTVSFSISSSTNVTSPNILGAFGFVRDSNDLTGQLRIHAYRNGNVVQSASLYLSGGSQTAGIGTSIPASVWSIQGTSSAPSIPLLLVASSTAAPLLTVGPNGSTTISSLGTGLVRSSSGALYNGAINLSSGADITGTLVVTRGGTGINAYTKGQLLAGNEDLGLTAVAVGSDGQVLTASSTAYNGIAWSTVSGSLSGGTPGFSALWNSGTTLTTGVLRDNGTVAGVNATSSSYTFNVQGSSGISPFNIASSTGTTLFNIGQNGSTTLGSLGTGCVGVSSGSLYTTSCGGAGGTPAGSSGQLQFNNAGSFGANAALLWDNTNNRLAINSSSPIATFVVQGSSTAPTLDILRVATSTGKSWLTVAANGSTTISSLSAGRVIASSTGLLSIAPIEEMDIDIGSCSRFSGLALGEWTASTTNTSEFACDSATNMLKMNFGSAAPRGEYFAAVRVPTGATTADFRFFWYTLGTGGSGGSNQAFDISTYCAQNGWNGTPAWSTPISSGDIADTDTNYKTTNLTGLSVGNCAGSSGMLLLRLRKVAPSGSENTNSSLIHQTTLIFR